LILEDFFPTGPVDTALIDRLHAAMVFKGAPYRSDAYRDWIKQHYGAAD
jgi:hypothetical protein